MPEGPTVETWMLALVPSWMFKPVGRTTLGRHNVPLPVSFSGSGLREMLKLVTLLPRPRLKKT